MNFLFISFGMLGIMWTGSIIINRIVNKFLNKHYDLTPNFQKELKWVIYSIVDILIFLFVVLFFLLSL